LHVIHKAFISARTSLCAQVIEAGLRTMPEPQPLMTLPLGALSLCSYREHRARLISESPAHNDVDNMVRQLMFISQMPPDT